MPEKEGGHLRPKESTCANTLELKQQNIKPSGSTDLENVIYQRVWQ